MINQNSRYLILGKNGLLGMDLQTAFHDRDYVAVGHADLDITDEESLKRVILNAQPDVVINAVAYKDVNKAESDEEAANEVNGYAVGKLAKICRDFGITLVHISTDYVFDGQKRDGYLEEDLPNPINAYGRSKLLGEQLLMEAMEAEYKGDESEEGKYFIVRTSYLFGKHGNHLISKLMENIQNGLPFKVIRDQWASPTYSWDLCKQIKWLLESNEYESGIYHITNSGSTNWEQLARQLLTDLNLDIGLAVPCSMNEWVSPAKRPQYSLLKNTKLPILRHWKDALKDYLN